MEDMESFILENLELQLPASLCRILESNAEDPLPWLLPFSTKLYLSVIESYLKHHHIKRGSIRKKSASYSNSHSDRDAQISEEKLWLGIKGNLEKDLGKRDKITMPNTTVLWDTDAAAKVKTDMNRNRSYLFFKNLSLNLISIYHQKHSD